MSVAIKVHVGWQGQGLPKSRANLAQALLLHIHVGKQLLAPFVWFGVEGDVSPFLFCLAGQGVPVRRG